MVDLLECTVMPYAWGSRTAIAELQNRTPSDAPEAELWMGAHPVAPSRVVREGGEQTLAEAIADAPARELGEHVASAFGARLPFLLKVLAAAEPLSLQAHPTESLAERGFAEEERRGILRDAPMRNYKDASHKPELLCALGPFDALSGFRAVDETLRVFDGLSVRALEPFLQPLRRSPDAAGLAATFRALMTLPPSDRTRVVEATVSACGRASDAFAKERALVVRLGALYPGDMGVVTSLLLNLVHLEQGDAIYLGAGNLHAYLGGVGVEIMASSDNVLRGGLTRKHVDVAELFRVLDFASGPAPILRPARLDEHEEVYRTPAREFELSRIALALGEPVVRRPRGPEILLVTSGEVTIEGDGRDVRVARGRAAFVPAAAREYVLRGDAAVYRATVPIALT